MGYVWVLKILSPYCLVCLLSLAKLSDHMEKEVLLNSSKTIVVQKPAVQLITGI